MGIPTADGPDLIINRMRDDVTTPWTRILAGTVVGLWLLAVLVPFVVADDPSVASLIRWSAFALIALVLTLVLPPLIRQERRSPMVASGIVAAAAIVLVWVVTA